MASFKDVAMRSVNPATKDPQKPQVPKQAKKDNHIKAFKNPSETVVALSLAAAKKADQTIIVLILLSVWAGLFIAIAGAASLTVGGGLQFQTVDRVGNLTFASATQFTLPILPRLGLACTFPIGLILILLLGGELFTGNTMVMSLGILTKRTGWKDLVISWVISFFGNWAGCVLGAVAFWGMGTLAQDPYHAYLSTVVMPKVNNNFGVNLLKAIPCNILVCTAVVLSNEAEDISGKIIGAWWPIFTFAVAGFEHSIANQFFVTLGAFYGLPFNYGTFIWQNLIPVTIGNTIGGVIFVALVSWYTFYLSGASHPERSKKQTKLELADVTVNS